MNQSSRCVLSTLPFLLLLATACGPTETLAPSDTKSDEPLTPIEIYKDGTVSVGSEWFESVSDFHHSAMFMDQGRRCTSHPARVENAEFRDAADCSFDQSSILPEYQPGVIYEIPVVFHIIERSDGAGAVALDLVRSQVDVLNEDFQALSGSLGEEGANSTIRFVLASTDPSGNPTSGIEYITNDGYFSDPGSGLSPMKQALNWDPTRFFNIYTNDASGALGYATFPSENAGDSTDGVVLLWSSVGRNNPLGGEFNLGRTATHEVGHYLGLFHTFQDGCDSGDSYSSGDRLADTVNHPSPNFSCTENGASSCGGGNNPVRNYMNYTEDACMTRFTAEQANRMRCSLINYRDGLFRVVGSTGNQSPLAGFTAQVADLSVELSDTSSDADGSVVAWNWQLGDGTTSSEQHPSHTYTASGTYMVSLQVTDDEGATSTFSASVSVAAPQSTETLVSGVPVSGLAELDDGSRHFQIEVPAGASRVTFMISAMETAGDADLYVRFGSAPTVSAWDYRPYDYSANEVVEILNPDPGTYYVMVHAYTAFSGVEILATVDTSSAGDGMLLINEVLADPGTFDSNQDGVSHFAADEFVELLNVGAGPLDLSGATFSDAVGVRFTFPTNTIVAPGGAVVIFGSESITPPTLAGAQTFGARLQLNNGGDVLTIRDADGLPMAMLSYGSEGSHDQSLVREVDGTDSAFVQHRQVSSVAASPGTRSDGSSF